MKKFLSVHLQPMCTSSTLTLERRLDNHEVSETSHSRCKYKYVIENGQCINFDRGLRYKKELDLCKGALPFLLNCTRKYNRFEAFLTTSLMCSFHNKLLVTVTISSFALWKISNSCTTSMLKQEQQEK